MLTAAFRPPSGGWYVRPPPHMQHRGRSRQISAAAKARVASQERRARLIDQLDQQAHLIPTLSSSLLLLPEMATPSSKLDPTDSPSSSYPIVISPPAPPQDSPLHSCDSSTSTSASASLDSYDSPPSPPSSLEDQVQVAYAMDDIRLAKILLLKLKGIEVTSDSDPRIDEVRDEDFDVYFVPSGPLTLEDADKQAMEETQRKQRECLEKSQRTVRLEACEKLWEDEKRRLSLDKLAATRRRELDHERRLAVQRQQCERSSKTRPEIYSYLKPRQDEEPFQYTFMTTKPLSLTLTRHSVRSSKASGKQAAIRPSGSPNSTVSFKEVIQSMNGRLFCPDVSEQVEDARRIAGLDSFPTTRHRRKAFARLELLENLLQPVEWKGDRRRPAGDGPRRCTPRLSQSIVSESAPIPSTQSSDSLTSLSSPLSSRSNSWFSFGSWRSTYTDVTIPDSQTPSSPECSKPVLLPSVHESQRDHHYPRSYFVRISLDESPLTLPRSLHNERHDDGDIYTGHTDRTPHSPDAMRKTFLQRVSRSVSGMVGAARGIQSAYISAALLTAGSSTSVGVTSRHQLTASRRLPARPEGYRAHFGDVKKFTCPDILSAVVPVEPVLFIPLVNLGVKPPCSAGLPAHRLSTADGIIIPSPLRPRTPPTVLAYRMRPIANPALLRLRALQNLMCAREKEWEGRGRDGGLGCGKERILGVAFEGRGRSGLGCEVRFEVA
ncbi:hypothetical protein J3A83DRAFT_3228148 [Scleroderma citrinum]